MRPMFSFYGGKWRAAARLYEAPKYDVLIEPFAGSAGYALRYWRPDLVVHLYDIDPIICGVWDFLIHATPEEILAMPDLEQGQSVDDLALTQEQRWLIGFWINNSCTSPRKTLTAHATKRPYLYWRQAIRERLARQVPMLRRWTITQASYDQIDTTPRATWFVDPPYQSMGKLYRFGSDLLDEKLARWCRNLRGQVIVCESTGATWLDFEHQGFAKAMSNSPSPEAVCLLGDHAGTL